MRECAWCVHEANKASTIDEAAIPSSAILRRSGNGHLEDQANAKAVEEGKAEDARET